VSLVVGGLVAPAPADAIAPTVIRHVDEVIDAPRALFGRTRAEVERRLGPPLEIRVARAAGAPEASGPRPVHDLVYPGLVLRFTETARLHRVVLTASAWHLPHALGVGVARRAVEDALGEPQEDTETRSLYLYSDGYPDTVEFFFREGRLWRVEWSFWAE
jgi:hypothetical protein